MYKGKRRRLRKKDLHEQNTFTWGEDIHLGKYKFWITGTKRRFFSKKSVGTLDIHGQSEDILTMDIMMSLYEADGSPVFKDKPFVLLPGRGGRKYYWADEEQV